MTTELFAQLRFKPSLGKAKKKEDLAAGGPKTTGPLALLGIGQYKWQTAVKVPTYVSYRTQIMNSVIHEK